MQNILPDDAQKKKRRDRVGLSQVGGLHSERLRNLIHPHIRVRQSQQLLPMVDIYLFLETPTKSCASIFSIFVPSSSEELQLVDLLTPYHSLGPAHIVHQAQPKLTIL